MLKESGYFEYDDYTLVLIWWYHEECNEHEILKLKTNDQDLIFELQNFGGFLDYEMSFELVKKTEDNNTAYEQFAKLRYLFENTEGLLQCS